MDPRKLKQLVLKIFMDNQNLEGASPESVAYFIEKQLSEYNIKRKRVLGIIDVLVKEGKLNIVKGKKGSQIVVRPRSEAYGTLIVFPRGRGGQIIVSGTNTKLYVASEDCAAYRSGDQVGFRVDGNNKTIITSRIKSGGATNAGIPVNSTELIKGFVIKNEYGTYEFVAEDKRKYPHSMLILNSGSFNNLNNAVVVVKPSEADSMRVNSSVEVVEVSGRIGEPLAETNAIAIEANVSIMPTPYEEKQSAEMPTEVDLTQYNLTDEDGNYLGEYDSQKDDYVDLRGKMFTTVDPFDCRDMDDSVYTEIDEDGNLVTYSAIADVTEYIRPNTPLWEKAVKQCFTLYTPYKAFAMINELLANGILSLNEGQDRLTMCVRTVIDKNTGKRIDGKTKIMHAVINSRKKFSYEETQGLLDSPEGKQTMVQIAARIAKGEKFVPTTTLEALALNKICSDKIWGNFNSRNTLNIDRNDEKRYVLDETGTRVLDIVRKEHIPTMSMIEALMINANEAVAEYTRDNKLNSVYRVHDEGNAEKLERLRAVLDTFGITYTGNGDNISLQKLIKDNANSPYSDTIKEMVLRTQSKAKYSNHPYPSDKFGNEKPECKCHSALQSECYTHFTSGIRRMADLIVQYAIKEHLRGHGQAFTEEYVAQMSALISSQELAIEEAEHKINDLHEAIWAEDHINEVMEGRIVAFTPDFVILEDFEKGVRVHVKMDEMFPNCTMDSTGAVMYNANGEVVGRWCDKVTYKICAADRVGRMVYASTNLNMVYQNPYASGVDYQTLMGEIAQDAASSLVDGFKTFQGIKNGQVAQPTKPTPGNNGMGKK